MIAHLRGTVGKGKPGVMTVDVQGVGYRVLAPMSVWDQLEDGRTATVHISSYIREDRFDLFGFADAGGKALFEALIECQGVGPKMGLELCDVPRSILLQAIAEDDASVLKNVKGVGTKTAEKLLLELKNLSEKDPGLFASPAAMGELGPHLDRDAVAALLQLGYAQELVMETLKALPRSLKTTEDRVTAALRSL
ncbi:MAG: Holliday junction branch migration protein RuvA [Candidatus Peribacteraceae bacterium]|nr:Holliday junction branch migration protein RuvA [Candidatus Peribacteraceae bacterium]